MPRYKSAAALKLTSFVGYVPGIVDVGSNPALCELWLSGEGCIYSEAHLLVGPRLPVNGFTRVSTEKAAVSQSQN
jgi:hypothetical protein